MLSYRFKCRKNTESKNTKVLRSENGRRRILLLKCAMRDSKKQIVKQQEASGFLNSLGIKTVLSELPLMGPSFVLIVLNKLIQGIK